MRAEWLSIFSAVDLSPMRVLVVTEHCKAVAGGLQVPSRRRAGSHVLVFP